MHNFLKWCKKVLCPRHTLEDMYINSGMKTLACGMVQPAEHKHTDTQTDAAENTTSSANVGCKNPVEYNVIIYSLVPLPHLFLKLRNSACSIRQTFHAAKFACGPKSRFSRTTSKFC